MADSPPSTLPGLFGARLREHSGVLAELEREIRGGGTKSLVLQNLAGSALAIVVAELSRTLGRSILILVPGAERAGQLVDDLEFFGVPTALEYPKWEILPYDQDELSLEVTAKQLDCFEAMEQGCAVRRPSPFVLVATADATMQLVLPRERLSSLTTRLAWGDRVDLAALGQALDRAGYEREPLVESRGEYSIRGGILDIYPPNAAEPLRIDLFGDEIESVRHFDISTQRSTTDLGAEARLAIPAARLRHQIEDFLKSGGDLVPFFDLLPPDTLILLDSPERFDESCKHFHQTVERQYFEVLKASPELPAPQRLVLEPAHIYRHIEKFRHVSHSLLPIESLDKSTRRLTFPTLGYTASNGELQSWIAVMKRYQGEDYMVVVACDNEGQVQRFDELLREAEISAVSVAGDVDEIRKLAARDILRGFPDVVLTTGLLHGGFALQDARLAFLTDREIFGRYKRRHIYKKIYKGRPISSSNEIQRGDFVVHVEHGIGRYVGMRQQNLDGRTVDLLELLYGDGNKLLVPVEKIRYVQKYSGSEGGPPALDKLGSGRWAKRRAKSNEDIEKFAEELLKLYAKREAASRKPYGPDTVWQHEFESSFLYTETNDQLKAINEAKGDLERTRPMDRLVCGDVGYGKTEVAIRAVFKCIQAGRQAAVLVPTTILAQQHYNTFRERFADYPIRVEMLSRFRSPKESKEVIKALKTGEVQVVIGTHRLISKDVVFLDLGLLVVDEEHRFGVKAKERLKEMRAEVDILTLTATPIPRTLHMALSGLRDLSVITTPPPDRHPIKTRIINFEVEQIAEAILRELNRGGQVYFVHNRVHNIQEIANRLQEIVPHARIACAHGQMDEEQLEDVMLRFVDQQFDILVATSIIESGLDIPNANTIIVNRADAFGLAQLYQLRGRVGRDKRRSYAYLIVPQGQAITEAAVKRLAAIEEFTELGVGFNIAMRDMEIRGAGDILGKSQHGTISEIGFELYCEMLENAVHRLKGEDICEAPDVEIKWPISSYIPTEFIPVETQRLNFYKRLAAARREEDLSDLEAELRDRYGEFPTPVRAILAISRLRIQCARCRVSVVNASATRVRLTLLAPEAHLWKEDVLAGLKQVKGFAAWQVEGMDGIALTLAPGGDALSHVASLTALLKTIQD